MKHIELSDLNHRMLIEKMREDLRALEKKYGYFIHEWFRANNAIYKNNCEVCGRY